jgi:hypothetical protein
MDHKKRLKVMFIILVLITYGIWQFDPGGWRDEVFPISFRVTALFGMLLLAFNDIKKLLLKLNSPTGILIGIGLLMAVIYRPSATKPILLLLIGCIAVLAILAFIRGQFEK